MKSGMEMMIESMGIQTSAIKQLLDPENIKQLLRKIEIFCNDASETRMAVMRIETKLGTLPETVAMKLLEDGQSDAFKYATEFVRGYNGESRENGVKADGNSGNSNNGNGSDTGHANGN
jgi:hypothetical protein